MVQYFKLGIAALLPVLFSIVLYVLENKALFHKADKKYKQLIYGIVFGLLAVVGTEWGIPINGAQMNCRDAAVLVAGLMFGGPAGIIAGVIGGVERWFAVAWGVSSFTRVACSISTAMAGFFAAGLRKFLFEDKKPGTLLSFAIGVVMEVFHLTMVFVTNMSTPAEAMEAVRVCSVPMIAANAVSVALTAFVLSLLAKEKETHRRKSHVRISQTIQRWLLLTVTLAFFVSSFFVFRLQNELADKRTDSLLSLALAETTADIRDASDHNLLKLTHTVALELAEKTLGEIAQEYGIAEINIVNQDGVIVRSTQADFIGYDMKSGEQSADFLCLLGDKDELVQDYGPISYNQSISRKYAGVAIENGFVQIGYNAEQFQKDIDAQIIGITKNRHVGKTGYILIMDEQFSLVSAPADFKLKTDAHKAFAGQIRGENTTFRGSVGDVDSFCQYSSAEGYFIVSVLPVQEAMEFRNIAILVNTYVEILVFAVLFGLIYLLIKRVVVNRIKDINNSLTRITGGDLNEVINVRSNEEFASLSDDINSTVETLKRYIDEASARIDAELEFAKNIQTSALPNVFPAFPKCKEFDIFASMNPAKEVGGDFYDFYMTDSNTLHFVVADVSGKGIPAAMFMMRAKTELKSLTEAGMPLNEVFTHGNEALCEGNDAGMFVTAWQGGMDLSNGLVQFANAGHNPPILRHADGTAQYLKTRAGFVLAGMEGMRYKTQEVQLQQGDVLYLYTDGVTEASNADNVLYGEERLMQAITAKEFDDMRELCAFVKADVDAFVGRAPQFDDITMVALRYVGIPPVPSIHFEHASIEDIPKVTAFAEQELKQYDCPTKAVVQISVAIDEIFSNIVRYGYKNEQGSITVELFAEDAPKTICIRFIDKGVPYNPLAKDDPDVTLSADEREIGGLGIFMVKKTMDDVEYKYENGQNILTLKKNIG